MGATRHEDTAGRFTIEGQRFPMGLIAVRAPRILCLFEVTGDCHLPRIRPQANDSLRVLLVLHTQGGQFLKHRCEEPA